MRLWVPEVERQDWRRLAEVLRGGGQEVSAEPAQ